MAEDSSNDDGRRSGLVLHSSWGRLGHGQRKLGTGLQHDKGVRFVASWRATHTTALGRGDLPVEPGSANHQGRRS